METPLNRRVSDSRRREQKRRPYMLLFVALVAAAGWRYSTRPVPALGGTLDIAPAVVSAPDEVASPSPSPSAQLAAFVSDSLLGLSGKLRARFLSQSISVTLPQLSRVLDRGPGIYTAKPDSAAAPFAFVALHPFAAKRGDRMGAYRMGFWPAEMRLMSSAAYENPEGFIEVTRENQDLYVSEHFRLRDFITHDQNDVWPKYLVLREALLDKLELVIADLNVHDVKASNVVVMSGFRTPHHNKYGIGGEGGARDSRHQFGDGADIIVDSDRNGRMDDLNLDGRVDLRDVDEILRAVDRVERLYPDLVGGAGRYAAMGPSGPFVHIDVRGYKARWGSGIPGARRASSKPTRAEVASTKGTCRATGASAVLCAVRSRR